MAVRDHHIIIIFANEVTVGSLTAKLLLDLDETKKKLVKGLTSLLFRVLLIKPFQVFQASGITGINGCAKKFEYWVKCISNQYRHWSRKGERFIRHYSHFRVAVWFAVKSFDCVALGSICHLYLMGHTDCATLLRWQSVRSVRRYELFCHLKRKPICDVTGWITLIKMFF